MGGIFTRSLIFGIGFVCPAYNTFKTLEGSLDGSMSASAMDEARREWLTYWIVFSFFYVVEEWLEWVLALVPMYFLLKLLFIVWLWAPQTKGSKWVYTTFVRPYLTEHEAAIDEGLVNARAKVTELGNRATQRGKEMFPILVRQVMAKTSTIAAFQAAAAAAKPQLETEVQKEAEARKE